MIPHSCTHEESLKQNFLSQKNPAKRIRNKRINEEMIPKKGIIAIRQGLRGGDRPGQASTEFERGTLEGAWKGHGRAA